MNSVKILHAVRSAITAIAELLVMLLVSMETGINTLFIPDSTGRRSVKILQETQALWSKIKWHVFVAHGILSDKSSAAHDVDGWIQRHHTAARFKDNVSGQQIGF